MVTRVEKSPPPGAPGEDGQAGDFATLDAISQAGEGLDAPKPADQKAEQQVLASEAEEIAGALAFLREAAVPFAPPHVHDPLLLVWSDKQLLEIGKAIVECCRASGITVTDWYGKHGHWFKLAMALGLPALTTLKLLNTPPPPPMAQRTDGQQ